MQGTTNENLLGDGSSPIFTSPHFEIIVDSGVVRDPMGPSPKFPNGNILQNEVTPGC